MRINYNLLVIIVFASILVGCAKTNYLLINPPQANILGRQVYSYDPKTNSISIGELNTDSVDFEYEINEASQEYVKSIESVFIGDFLGYSTKNIRTTNVTMKGMKIHRIKGLKNFYRGRNFIFSGISADSLIVDIGIKKVQEVDVAEITSYLSDIVKVVDPTKLSYVSELVDSIKYKNLTQFTYSVSNSSVLNSVEIANIKSSSIIRNYYKPFNSEGIARKGVYMGDNQVRPEFVFDSRTRRTNKITPGYARLNPKRADPINIWLSEIDGDLYVNFSKPQGGQERKLIKQTSEGIWDIQKMFVYEFPTDQNVMKIVFLSLYAEVIFDKSGGKLIGFDDARIEYPEYEIKILEFRDK
jgi:hypothetical protein